jgi:uncharacterized protein
MTKNSIYGRGWAFPPHLGDQNRLQLVSDDIDIRQAIYIIIFTAPGERVMRPDFGCQIHELVFAPANSETAALAERYVREALVRWEPRIDLQEVKCTPGNTERGELMIEVSYKLKNQFDLRSLVYPYYLIPGVGD